jgi:hypothetical protein
VEPVNNLLSVSSQNPDRVPWMLRRPCTYVLFTSPKDVVSTRSVERSSVHAVCLMTLVAVPVPVVET